MQGFQVLVPYRDPIEASKEIFPIDSEDLVIGLQSFGILPFEARTDGKKLQLTFEKDDKTMGVYHQIQKALAGVGEDPLMVDYTKIVKNRLGWKGLLTMMRSVPIQRG